ncbi:MAG TPA: hypothetical protein VIP77_16215 [Jiangellaceae bacterium]
MAATVREYLGTVGVNTTVSVNTGAGTQVGDVLLVFQGIDFGDLGNLASPSGTAGTWTLKQNDTLGNGRPHVKAWWRYVTVGGAQTVNVTADTVNGSSIRAHVYVIQGADQTDPFDGAAGNGATSATTSHVCASVSPATSDALLVGCVSSESGSGYTAPGSFTNRAELDSGFSSGKSGEEALVASGATGTRTFTGPSSNYASVTVAIKAAAAAVADSPQFIIRAPGRIAPGGRWTPWPGTADPPSVAAIPLADSGTGTEALTLSAAVPLTESGTGADTLVVAVSISLADTGTGTETLNAGISIPLAESGTGADAVTVSATTTLAETGAGADAATVTAAATLADAGSSTQALSVTATASLVDSGTGNDGLTAGIAIPLADAGTGSDALTVQIGAALADAGISTQALGVAALASLADTGASAQLLTITATAPLAETGAGTEALGVGRPVALADAGSGSDALAVSIPPSVIIRPNTGAVARPNTGSVTRPTTGTVTRPATGTITRPNTGTIPRP